MITLTDFTTIRLERLLLITNVTRGVFLYQFNVTSGAAISGNTVTLTMNTNSMGSTDKLQIIYDCEIGDPMYGQATNVAGDVASGTADSGNPVKVGGRYNATTPSLTDGQRGDIQLDASGKVLVNAGSGSSSLYTGQVTVSTTAMQLSTASHALTTGLIVKTPTTNSGNIYVGLSGVTTTTGDILEPGESRGYAINNTNLLYIVSISSTTDIVSYSGN